MAGIFKAYDIRGVVGEGLDERIAYLIGRGLADAVFQSAAPIVVSRDMRTHSPQLAARLVRGLCEGGRDVLDIGLAATPMNYWANVHYQSGGSVTVTASHNGPEYNGFKVSGANAAPIDYSNGLNCVEEFVRQAQAGSTPAVATAPGQARQIENALDEYLNFMLSVLPQSDAATDERPVKIAVDAGNGMAGFFMPELERRLPWLECVPLYWKLDGTFPHHEADPLKAENLRDVCAAVLAHNCDFGVAFDGDADRCMFVDNQGQSISSDLMTAFIAKEVLRRAPGSAILYDLRSSHIVPETIKAHGGTAVRGRVGHSFMKRLLKEKDAPFGGELSGHYYFRDCFNTDSGLMALLEVLQVWRRSRQTLAEMVAPLRCYAASGEINFRVENVPQILQRIEARYRSQNAHIDHLDGLTVELPEWWFSLRSSNTEPLLRLNLEAATPQQREEKLREVQALING
jgi:phosphomannomutase